MVVDEKKVYKKRGKKGIFALTQNLVVIIIILVLVAAVTYIIFKFVKKTVVPLE